VRATRPSPGAPVRLDRRAFLGACAGLALFPLGAAAGGTLLVVLFGLGGAAAITGVVVGLSASGNSSVNGPVNTTNN